MTRRLLLGLFLGLAFLPAAVTQAQEESPGSLQERIDNAAPGDDIFVDGGIFNEAVVIDKPLSLIGSGLPVIDGGEQGDVVTITSDDVSLSGFVIRNSGRTISKEPAAVKADGVDRLTLRANRIEDSLYGLHVTGSEESAFENNTIDLGVDTPIERRGHAIYLWQVDRSAIHGNTIRNSADAIHLEFSDDNGIGENTATDSRYALHFMSTSGNRIVENTFRHNLAGAVLMFSQDLIVKDNEFFDNRQGATGSGMLLKDVDNIFVEGNKFVRNKYGMTVDGTPQERGATAIFVRNLFALNDTGVGAMSNAPITFVENAMIENTVQVKALGGNLASQVHGGHGSGGGAQPSGQAPSAPKNAVWATGGRGNYWSDYNGYDANGDGVGDRPYEPQPPFAGGLAANDTLRVFQFTLAQQAIDTAADMFPIYRYEPVIADPGPLMSPPGPALPRDSSTNGGMLAVSALLVLLSLAALQAILDIDVGRIFRRVAAAGGPAGG